MAEQETLNKALIQGFENADMNQVREAIGGGADARCITPAHIPPRAETESYLAIMRYLFSEGDGCERCRLGWRSLGHDLLGDYGDCPFLRS